MRTWSILIILSFLSIEEINPFLISKINGLKKEGEHAFEHKNWKKAASKYGYLVDTLDLLEDELILNLGHVHLNLEDTALATSSYMSATNALQPEIRSKAYQQLGYMSADQGKLESALELFKKSLIEDYSNDISRYNYELIKKILEKLKEDKKDDELEKPDKPNEPSEYAKQLKQQAERLAARFQYSKAVELMQQGLNVDPTVAYYKDFVKRLSDVAEIVNSTP